MAVAASGCEGPQGPNIEVSLTSRPDEPEYLHKRSRDLSQRRRSVTLCDDGHPLCHVCGRVLPSRRASPRSHALVSSHGDCPIFVVDVGTICNIQGSHHWSCSRCSFGVVPFDREDAAGPYRTVWLPVNIFGSGSTNSVRSRRRSRDFLP